MCGCRCASLKVNQRWGEDKELVERERERVWEIE